MKCRQFFSTVQGSREKVARTFREFAAVELAGLELDGDDVTERLVEKLDRHAEAAGHLEGLSGGGEREERTESSRTRGAGRHEKSKSGS